MSSSTFGRKLQINNLNHTQKISLIPTKHITSAPRSPPKNPPTPTSRCSRLIGRPLRRHPKPVHTPNLVREPLFQKRWRLQQHRPPQLLRILEHQEEVQVSHENPHQLHKTTPRHNQIKCEQHPGQVHGLELGAEPETDDCVFV